MSDTLDFSELTKNSEDLFELVVATSKRARQINALKIARDPLPTLGEGEEETFDETPDEEEHRDWDRAEKPATMALNEMMTQKLEYRHTSQGIEEEEDLEDIESDLEE